MSKSSSKIHAPMNRFEFAGKYATGQSIYTAWNFSPKNWRISKVWCAGARPEFCGGNALPIFLGINRVNDRHACGSSGPFRTTVNLPLAQTHNQRHTSEQTVIRPESMPSGEITSHKPTYRYQFFVAARAAKYSTTELA